MRRLIVYRSAILPISETFIKEQILGLRRWQAELVGDRALADGLDLSGVRTRVIGGASGFIARWRWRLFEKTGWLMPTAVQQILAGKPELIHVHFATDAVTAWRWQRHVGVPVVVTLHGYDINMHPEFWTSGRGGAHMSRFPDDLRNMAKSPRVSFIAVSEAVRRRAISAYGISPDRVRTLHIGIDHEAFTPSDVTVGRRPPKVLFVGRLVEKKGVAVLLKAMQAVQADLPDAEVLLVGDGPDRANNEALASELGIRARFLGAQRSDAVRKLLTECRALCLPSVTTSTGDAEGFGLVLLEAQAAGVPVVTSALGGRDEGLIEGQTGYAFAEFDHATLARRLSALLIDDDLADRMGREGRRFVTERFTLQACCASLETYYDELVASA